MYLCKAFLLFLQKLKKEIKIYYLKMQDVTLFITDRDGKKHEVQAPTDMAMNVCIMPMLYRK